MKQETRLLGPGVATPTTLVFKRSVPPSSHSIAREASAADRTDDTQKALNRMKRAGIEASCLRTGRTWTATAVDHAGRVWLFTAQTQERVIDNITKAMGLEDLD